MAMGDSYYIRQGNGPAQGPFEADRIRRYIAEGRVRRRMWFSTDGAHWVRGRDVPALFPPRSQRSGDGARTSPPKGDGAATQSDSRSTATPPLRRRPKRQAKGPGPWVVIGPIAGLLVLVLAVWAVKSVPTGSRHPQEQRREGGGAGTSNPGGASGGARRNELPAPKPEFGADLAAIAAHFRHATQESITSLTERIAEADAQGVESRALRETKRALERMITDVDPRDPRSWVVPDVSIPQSAGELRTAWRSARSSAQRAQLDGIRAWRSQREHGVVESWRRFARAARICRSLVSELRAQDASERGQPPALSPEAQAENARVGASARSADALESRLTALEERIRESELDGPARADAIELHGHGSTWIEQARQTMSVARRLLHESEGRAAVLVPRYLDEAQDLLHQVEDALLELDQLLAPAVTATQEDEGGSDTTDAGEQEAAAAKEAAWPDAATWGDVGDSDLADLDQPVLGVKITNKTAKVSYRRQKYIWTDDAGRRWTGYRRVADGDVVTLYVRITAIDTPADVMGITGHILFTAGAAQSWLTFPVRSVPMRAGESHVERVLIHVPQATIEREGGNWLRKAKSDDLGQFLRVRLTQVRFMDGRVATYRTEPTVSSSDVQVGPAMPYPIYDPQPGLSFEDVAASRDALTVVPYKGGRVWVPRQRTKRGIWIPGHWRRRPPPEALPTPSGGG